MSQDDLYGAPAGWYPDPLGLPQLRWWNNHAWTEQTAAARQPMVVQDTAFAWADDEPATRREGLRRERAGDRTPTDAGHPTAETLRQLDPPLATAKVDERPRAAEDAPPARSDSTEASAGVPRAADLPGAATADAGPASAPRDAQAEAAGPEQPVAAGAESSSAPGSDTQSPLRESAHWWETEGGDSFASLFDAAPAAPASTFAAKPDSFEALFGAPPGPRRMGREGTPIVPSEFLQQAGGPAAVKMNTSTGPVWVLAMLPLLQLVVSLLLLTTFGNRNSPVVFAGILVVSYLVGPALAYADRRGLLKAGTGNTAHWAWAFLTAPVYLLLRARLTLRESGQGIAPVLVWFALAVLQVVSVVAIPGQLIATLPSVFADQIEQSVQADAALLAGADMTVDCPPTPPVLPGEEITCTSTSGDQSNPVVVTLARSNGWIAWQVIDWGVIRFG